MQRPPTNRSRYPDWTKRPHVDGVIVVHTHETHRQHAISLCRCWCAYDIVGARTGVVAGPPVAMQL